MPKGKVIDVRPKKRGSHQRSADTTDSNAVGKPKRDIGLMQQHASGDRIKHPKLKIRGHSGEKHNAFEFPFIGKLQKRMFFGVSALGAIVLVIAVLGHQYNLRIRKGLIKSASTLPKIISPDWTTDDLVWGTYRPGLYFGMKHRSPTPLMVGLMWSLQDPNDPKIRHFCDSNDGLSSYNWLEHDGRNFGVQQIVDSQHIINVSFVKSASNFKGGKWTVRVSAVTRNEIMNPLPLSVMVYFYYTNSPIEDIQPIVVADKVTGIQASSSDLGAHKIQIHTTRSALQVSSLLAQIPREDAVMSALYSGLGIRRDTQRMILVGKTRDFDANKPPNAWFHEVTVPPRTIANKGHQGQIMFEAEYSPIGDTSKPLIGSAFDERFAKLSQDFRQRFSQRFPTDLTKFTEQQTNLSKISLSNLLGGIGYFYGSSLIKSDLTGPEPINSPPGPLFTATPSRPMFPRGFLWDEGFHGLLLTRWDPELAMESVGHWLDLMNGEGWIPREQILGLEARSRVPEQFVVQQNTVANPPTLVLVVEALLDSLPKFSTDESKRFRHWATLVLPRLDAWYQWFNETQSGPVPLSYRWRGRNPMAVDQLNPLTLSSGLDDYPRASHPSQIERHLDLRCWMTLFSRVIARLATAVAQHAQLDSSRLRLKKLEEARTMAAKYGQWADLLSDPIVLDKLHWSETSSRYADYGLHTDLVRLQKPSRNGRPDIPEEEPKPIRVVDETPTYRLVTSTFGYVNLFPLLLRLIPPNSPRLSQLLADLGRKELWSDYGIRSVATNSPFYRKSNTQDDPPYWRGAIWLNMNYLTVRSLKYYASHSKTPSEVAREANRLSTTLAQNLVRNVLGELDRTGFLWEQYDDMTGKGQRGHPFSGWTSLVSLLLTE